MPRLRCPHCGWQTFSVSGWSELDRCPRCRRPFAKRDPRAVERRVWDYLYGPTQRRP
jgi:tRNA(Ile2) C34 agmatinyltransferase TiaS